MTAAAELPDLLTFVLAGKRLRPDVSPTTAYRWFLRWVESGDFPDSIEVIEIGRVRYVRRVELERWLTGSVAA